MNPMRSVSQVRITSPLLSGLVYALIMMTIGTIVTSLFLLLTSTQESSLHTLTMIIHGVSLFIGGWVAGKRAGSRGWYYGGMLGILYFLLIFLVGFLAFDAGLNLQSLQLLGILFVSGALGGMLGVNTRK
ncbi:TIGR04086 family membrane protein [Paenibacillus hexagrammi]|uniref:TIGR04086 family membrane protein n=1 Tax=Paenibacillus hexagrammi TaxID=2908839 RepID=A0ABY3SD98_9BACL|nr:TIGR04086 family membrane protein [Paenibacillus sp. YPD9-1]UJF31972.1 TIGR04086 family membrane protein [Paenibacillus sp. YPD9-1]